MGFETPLQQVPDSHTDKKQKTQPAFYSQDGKAQAPVILSMVFISVVHSFMVSSSVYFITTNSPVIIPTLDGQLVKPPNNPSTKKRQG